MIKRIKVYGSRGYVGKAIVNLFEGHYYILEDDPILLISFNNVKHTSKEIGDLAIVCVPTLMKEDGSCDISIVESVIKKAGEPLILIKSTIPPGTTKKLKLKYNKRICFSPEYIGEAGYMIPFWKGYPHPTDMKYHDFQIFGGDRKDTNELIQVFQKVLGPHCKYIQTDSTTAEVTKYMENAWLATKVTFCNEFYNIAKVFGVGYNELRELFLLDGRVERMHTSVFEESFGFGGKCLPKDNNAIIKACEEEGYIPYLLREVLNSNKRFITNN